MPAQQGAGVSTAGGQRSRARGRGRLGRLEAGQVRAMFDRIAGVYDLMNTAMTAGLHHRWRARAADLAQRGPGRARARRRHRHRRSGDRARAARVLPGGEVVGSDFAEACSTARARRRQRRSRRACARASSGPTRWSCPTRDGRFDAATVGFGARNFADLPRGLAEMARVVRPGGRVVVLEITTPDARAAVALLPAVVRPRRAGARAAGGL